MRAKHARNFSAHRNMRDDVHDDDATRNVVPIAVSGCIRDHVRRVTRRRVDARRTIA